MRMEAGLDTGPVYEVCEMPIAADETAGMLTARLADRGAQCLLHVLAQLQRGEAIAVPQESQGVVYAHKLEKRESVLDWADSAAVLAAKIRAFDPWPVAQTLCAGEVLRIWAAQVCAGSVAPPGTVVAITPAGIDVATGAGCLRLTRVQAAGRKPVTAREFMNAAGGSLAVGTALGL